MLFAVLGHPLGTARTTDRESALMSHIAIAESAVVGFSRKIKGQRHGKM
tara:strand:+ start:355518 stop:355664 length:147 start_codon:yes stop_codon:yes gene_type:complete